MIFDGASSAVKPVVYKSVGSKASFESWSDWVVLLPLLDTQTRPGEALALPGLFAELLL